MILLQWKWETRAIIYIKRKVEFGKRFALVLFIERTEIIWSKRYTNGLCVYIFIKYMEWCLGVIRKVNNDKCRIYIFT